VDEGDAVSVAGQLSDRLRSVLPQRPSVPHLAQRVVAAREEQLGRAVGERHRIHVVLVGINLTGGDAKERALAFRAECVSARQRALAASFVRDGVPWTCSCERAFVCVNGKVVTDTNVSD